MIELFSCLTAGNAMRMGGIRRRRGDGFDIAFKDCGRGGMTVGRRLGNVTIGDDRGREV